MGFGGLFNDDGEDSDGGSSEECWAGYRESEDDYDDEESLEAGGEPEAGKRYEEEPANGVGPDGANDVEGAGPSRRVAAGDFLGRVFGTEDDAYAAYKEFARFRGFGVRKGDVGRVNGILVRRDFFCHRQGTRHRKHYDRPDRVREERPESRTDCKAKLKIYYDMQERVWKVRSIVDEHNHELAPAMFTNLLPSHRKMSEGDKAQVDSFKQFGIATSKIMAYMAGQSGGYGMLRFTKRDLYNYVHGQRLARISDGDAAATIGYLEGKANADMLTSARYTRTPDNRLGSLFWADGEMIADYQVFGDVLAFDSTYRSNKYRKPLVIFSGSNHHKQTSIFGFALLEDEEVRTYRWVLLNLLDVMGQKKPCVVVTDGDKAMRAAIAEVIPTAKHRLCAWHLEKNCVQKVKETEFRKVFQKALYANLDIDEFEEFWKTSVQLLGLQDNSWVQSTYDSRESWAMAYLRGTFCAGYRTTSRCEGINSFVKGFLRSTDSILELVHSLDRVVKDYRNNEVTAQFYSTYYTPVLTTGLDSIEQNASKVYTRAVFREVKKQIKGVATLLFRGRDSISTTCVYKFSKTGKPSRTYRVLYDPSEERIECECSMWNSEGIPCSHIFCLMKYEGLEKISGSLILSRWCKDAKDWRPKPPESTEGQHGRLLRYGALCGAMSVVAKLGAEDANEFVVARDGIARLAEALQRRAYDKLGCQSGLPSLGGLKDPAMSKTKGAPRKGKEMQLGSPGEVHLKRRRCTRCGVPGHTKRTCTTRHDNGVAGTEAGTVLGSAECASERPSGQYAAGRSQDAATDAVMQSENDDNSNAVPVHGETNSTGSMHGCSHAYCYPRMGSGVGGANIFLGGQHIEQFISSQGCSSHQGGSHGVAASRGTFNPTRRSNEDLFEQWLTQNAWGRRGPA